MERVFNFSKEPFEEGHKTPKSKAVHFLSRQAPISQILPPLSYQLVSIFGTKEDRLQVEFLLDGIRDIPPESGQLIFKNMVFMPGDAFLRASPFHIDRWGRDLFYTLFGLKNPQPMRYQIDMLTRRNYRYPQIPSVQFFGSDREYFLMMKQQLY